MSNFFSGIGAVIATYIGTGISAYAAYKAWKAKSKVEEYRDELKIRIQDKELTKLIDLGKKAKNAANNFSSKKSFTSVGQKQEEANKIIIDFLTEINENSHLINNNKITKLYRDGKSYLDHQQYDDVCYTISDIIKIIKNLSDTNITRE